MIERESAEPLHYHSGGAGYVFSRGTLRTFVKLCLIASAHSCPSKAEHQHLIAKPRPGEDLAEDSEVGRSLRKMGIMPTDVLGDDGEGALCELLMSLFLIQYNTIQYNTGLEAFMPFALWYHRGMYRKDDPSYWYWKNSANYALDGEVWIKYGLNEVMLIMYMHAHPELLQSQVDDCPLVSQTVI